ncbi:hypothetical protein QZH41_017110 [Actinostola sp. cb2023]|nr:hypothetical protein QZH41_017110 [Actinostola sp. cb2023]
MGYAFAAVQNDSRCTCGVSYGRYGKLGNFFACNCNNNSNAIYKTGGIWSMKELFYGNPKQSHPLAIRHVIYKESSVKDVHLCASYCDTNGLCKSINYDHVSNGCEMNNVTSSEGDSHERKDFNYYEPIGVILNIT